MWGIERKGPIHMTLHWEWRFLEQSHFLEAFTKPRRSVCNPKLDHRLAEGAPAEEMAGAEEETAAVAVAVAGVAEAVAVAVAVVATRLNSVRIRGKYLFLLPIFA